MKKIIVIIMFFLMVSIIQNVSSDNPVKPSELKIHVSSSAPMIGDTVVVTLTEIPYSSGDNCNFNADVYYGEKLGDYVASWEVPKYILEDWSSTRKSVSKDKFQAEFSFVPDKEGLITIDVRVHRQYDVTFDYVQIQSYEKKDTTESTPGFGIVLVVLSVCFFVWERKKFGKRI